MGQRVKGQETVVTVIGPDGEIGAFDHIVSHEMTLEMEVIEEEYLSHTAKDYDDIFHGISGSLTAHLSQNLFWTFTEDVQSRAQRRVPSNLRYEITTQFNMPNGEIARVTIEDIKFGSIPVNISGRSEYVETSFDYSSSSISRVV